MYLRQHYTIYYELSRITTSNLRAFLRIVTSILQKVTIQRSFFVLVTTCLRVVTISYEYLRVLTIFGKSIHKNPANLYRHSTTDIKRDNMTYERNRLQLYQQFPQYCFFNYSPEGRGRDLAATRYCYESFTDSCEQFRDG